MPVVLLVTGCGDMVAPPEAPVIEITAPVADARVLVGDTVELSVAVLARDPGPAPLAFAWFVNDTLLALTARAVFVPEAPGVSVITVEVTAAGGLRARDRVAVQVAPNTGPLGLGIVMTPSTRVYTIDTIRLAASGIDFETNGPPSRVVWFTDTVALGTGDTLTVPPGLLAPGTYDITAILYDNQGLGDSVQSTLTIVPAPTRLRWASGPAGGYAFRSMLALRPDGVVMVAVTNVADDCWACLVALDASGQELWRRPIGVNAPNNHSGAITVTSDNRTFVMDFQGIGYAFSPTGAPLWETAVSAFDPHGRYALSPGGALYVAGRVVGSGATGALTRLDPTSGGVVWQLTAANRGNLWGGPFIDTAGNVATGLGGTMWWAQPDGSVLRSGAATLPATYSRGAMAEDGTTYHADSRLFAIAPDGSQRWMSTMGLPCCPSSISEPVIDANGIVYVVTTQGGVYAIEPATGAVRWSATVPSVSTQPWLALTDDGGLLLNAGTELLALDTQTGAQRWTQTLTWRIESSIAVGPDGVIYAMTADGRVHAFTGDAGEARGPWPSFRGNSRRTSSVRR